jgi:hypothetical protein
VKEGGKPGVVARVMGEDITEEQLIGEEKMDFFELKKREYDLRMERLNKLLVDRIIGAEAKKANMPLEEYIDKKIAKGKGEVSDSDYKKFVKEKRIPESQLNPQIEGRIKEYLKAQKKQDTVIEYVAKATKSNPVEVFFSKPRMQVAIENPLPNGITELDISVRLMVLGSAMTVQVKAVIRSTNTDIRPEFPATLLGLEFLDLDPTSQLAISQFVGERLLSEQDDIFGMVR